MKIIMCFVSIFFVISCFGQADETSKIGLYKWKEAILLKPCNINGGVKTKTIGSGQSAKEVEVAPVSSKPGQKFRVLKIEKDKAVIQVLDYTITSKGSEKVLSATSDFYKYNFTGTSTDYSNLSADETNSRNYGDKQAYFLVDIDTIESLAVREKIVGMSLATGVVNFPFKYRPQKGNIDFSGSFNFGVGIGLTFRHKSWRKFTHSVLSGYSISNIVLDSSNTTQNQHKLASTNNFTAFSFSIGYLIEYQKVQAGIFLGWDRLSKINHNEFKWQYQGRPWVSIGFGLAIFSAQNDKPQDVKSNNQQGDSKKT